MDSKEGVITAQRGIRGRPVQKTVPLHCEDTAERCGKDTLVQVITASLS